MNKMAFIQVKKKAKLQVFYENFAGRKQNLKSKEKKDCKSKINHRHYISLA